MQKKYTGRKFTLGVLALIASAFGSLAHAYDCTNVQQYTPGTTIATGQIVKNNNSAYQCTVGGWCTIGGPYEPGVGWAQANAWNSLGACTAVASSSAVPSSKSSSSSSKSLSSISSSKPSSSVISSVVSSIKSSSSSSSLKSSSSSLSSKSSSSSSISGDSCAAQGIQMSKVNTYPNWPQIDWQGNPDHANQGDLVCNSNTVYKANWYTSTVPGSDGSWTKVCTGVCDPKGGNSGASSGPDRNSNNLTLANLPYQISVNQGATRTVTFDVSITSIVSRKGAMVSTTINGNSVTFTGLKAGRTGLKITAGGQSYYMGFRVNQSNGAIPGLPNYLSVGSVSEDTTDDLSFWHDITTDLKNKDMDIRYIYINGGPIAGWRSWNATRVINFAKESLRFGLVPYFVYYNIPDGGESLDTDYKHIQDPTYMTAYFKDLDIFMTQAKDVLQDELYGIILEPDFLAYLQQNSGGQIPNNSPSAISTSVGASTIAANAGNLRTLVDRINATIAQKRSDGHNLTFGWMLNLWSYAPTSGGKGVLRRTDNNDLGFTNGRAAIKEGATATTQYAIDAGVLTHGANFLAVDRYGLDAAGTGGANPNDPASSIWYFNNDHWMNYLYYIENIHLTSQLPVVIWQLPVGHLNGSTSVSAYTNSVFTDLPNTTTKYEDSSTTFFLGDTFSPGNAARTSYFTENKYNDPKLKVNGGLVTWGNHMQETKNAGVISVMFGAGVGASTDGVGSPPTDDYFWIQKVQQYFKGGVIPLP